MNKEMETKAEAQVRVYKSTHKRLKIKAAQMGFTLAQLIDNLSLVTSAQKPVK
jgi:predicted HicB family RNase H-like nuclease